MKTNTQRSAQGFTLIELLVVIAIISLLTSIALIAYQSARQKSRDAKRLSDMTQLANAFELYFSYNKGYPSSTSDMQAAGVLNTLPAAPMPPDGSCATAVDFNNNSAAGYSYYPSGVSYVLNINGVNKTLYPGFFMTFCLGDKTGNFDPGVYYLTPRGIKTTAN